MKKHIVAPLALLASISLLTSCMDKKEAVVTPVVPPVQTAMPLEVVTTSTAATLETPVESGASVTPVENTPPTTVAPVEMAPTTQAPVVKTSTKMVSYVFPEGTDDIEFTLSSTDGVVTSVSVTPKAVHPVSLGFQEAFAASISAEVVGKNISGLSLSTVAGGSLTTAAFNKFVQSL